MNSSIPEIYFFFDSKNIFSLLSKNQKPEIFEIFDKGDEFQCLIKVEGVESLIGVTRNLIFEITSVKSNRS